MINDFTNIQPISDPMEERAVIGSVMSQKGAYHIVSKILSKDSFTDPLLKNIWVAVEALASKGAVIDLIRIKQYFDAEKVPYNFATLLETSNDFTLDLEFHAWHLKDLETRRSWRGVALDLIAASSSEAEDIPAVVSKITDKLAACYKTEDSVKTLRDNLREVYDLMLINRSDEKPRGTKTGFAEFDKKACGFFGSDLILLGADSSQGKTSLLQSIILNAAADGASIAVYSMEMTGAQLAARYLSNRSGVNSNAIIRRALDDDELQRVNAQITALADYRIFTDEDSGNTIDGIIASIRSLKIKHNITGAAVDFLQILSVTARVVNPELMLGECARKLKNLAKELNIWIVAVTQLNRDRDNPEPSLTRLRGSGQMNEAADVTLLLYRPEVYGRRYSGNYETYDTKGTALIKVAKGRNCGTFDFFVGFDAKTQRFYDLVEMPTATTDKDKSKTQEYDDETPF